jgi:hypothetical protein
MRKSIFIILLSLFTLNAFSQNAFQDAKTIIRLQRKLNGPRTPCDSVFRDSISGLLYKYVNGGTDVPTLNDLQAAYKFSTYISQLIKKTNDNPNLTITAIEDRLKLKIRNLAAKDLANANSLIKKIDLIKTLTQDTAIIRLKNNYIINKSDTGKKSHFIKTNGPLITESFSVLEESYDFKTQPDGILDMYKFMGEVFDNQTLLDSAQIKTIFVNDPVLPNITLKTVDLTNVGTRTLEISQSQQSEQQSQQISQQQAVAGKMSLPSESEVVDAVAIYLVNRVKTEASLAFFDRLKYALKDDSILLNLFPKTTLMMSNLQNYESPNFGQQWRHAFSEDFVTIPDKLAGSEDFQKYFASRLNGPGRQYYDFFRMVVKICSMSRDNANFIDIIDYLYQDIDPKANYMLNSYIRFLHMVNNEFFAPKGSLSKYWISYSEFNQLSNEELQVLVGLLEQKYPDVFNFIQVRLDEKDKTLPSISDLRIWMSRVFFIINQYQIAIQHTGATDSEKPHDVSSYWTFISDSFQQFTKQENGFFIVKIDPLMSKEQDISKYLNYLNMISSTYQDITGLYSALQAKNYPHAIETIKKLFSNLEDPEVRYREIFVKYFISEKSLKGKDLNTWLKNNNFNKFFAIVREFQADEDARKPKTKLDEDLFSLKNYAGTLRTEKGYSIFFNTAFIENADVMIKNLYDNYSGYVERYHQGRLETFTKVMNFIEDVMTTKNSQDLTNVITTYASPPQSYRIKRNSRFSIDLNAYVGVVAGLEDLKSAHFAYGLTAPIGLSFSWSGSDKKTNSYTVDKNGNLVYLRGNSNSISLSIIDIGAVVRYRFANDSSEGLPEKVNFSQFISPSIQYHIGVRNLPLDVVFGYQYLPKLRTLSDQSVSGTSDLHSASEFNIGVVFDLPLINFYHSN